MNQDVLLKENIIRLNHVQRRTGISRSGIYQRIKDGTFPKPINLGGRCMGFVEREIDCWISDRISESQLKRKIEPGFNNKKSKS